MTVLAGGGVVELDGAVLLVHRPRYDDWTFPKGKLEPSDESLEACALREVWEETGFVCELGAELAQTAYIDRKGRPKEVRYWRMVISSGDFEPTDEVDEIRFATADEARALLSYERDLTVLEAAFGGG
jgi:8-oxo-dGTP pyrophosphatase MutT (NUDIX family)